MKSLPFSRKVAGETTAMERLRENQVPQKTPVTRANDMMVRNKAVLVFISCRSSMQRKPSKLSGRLRDRNGL
jgi:hypothetical protein